MRFPICRQAAAENFACERHARARQTPGAIQLQRSGGTSQFQQSGHDVPALSAAPGGVPGVE